MTSFRALIFDFDGLILDTETPEIEVWSAIYAEHGQAYPTDYWSQIIGGWGNSDFDPAQALQELSPFALDVEGLRQRHRQQSNAMIQRAAVMDGVHEILDQAKRLGLRCAIASSSERDWVEPHLERLGLRSSFEKVITGDDVAKGRTKPHPDLYFKVLEALQLGPDAALVFEDSPNGVRAAHSANLRVVGVPNPVTAALSLEADLMLHSLAEMPLDDILKKFDVAAGPRAMPGVVPGAA